jgi:hypothetical protein
MARKRTYIPKRDDDFFNFQAKLVNMVVANAPAWGIPAPAVAALVARRAAYEPLYHKAQEKKDRTAGDVDRHRQMRKIYEKEIQTFVNAYLRFNPLVPRDNLIEMGIPPRDIEPTPRGKIETIPVVGLTAMGGGDLKVRCQVTTDATRYSRHPLSDGLEIKYTWVPKGEMPPEAPEDCNKMLTSSKAMFIIHCGPKNAGETFYGFFRWFNRTNDANSGPWSKAISVVIA